MVKAVHIKKLTDNNYQEDRLYWLNKKAQERFDAVELLRRQNHEHPGRLQRVFTITKLQ